MNCYCLPIHILQSYKHWTCAIWYDFFAYKMFICLNIHNLLISVPNTFPEDFPLVGTFGLYIKSYAIIHNPAMNIFIQKCLYFNWIICRNRGFGLKGLKPKSGHIWKWMKMLLSYAMTGTVLGKPRYLITLVKGLEECQYLCHTSKLIVTAADYDCLVYDVYHLITLVPLQPQGVDTIITPILH